jgi:hypothetical protein
MNFDALYVICARCQRFSSKNFAASKTTELLRITVSRQEK